MGLSAKCKFGIVIVCVFIALIALGALQFQFLSGIGMTLLMIGTSLAGTLFGKIAWVHFFSNNDKQ